MDISADERHEVCVCGNTWPVLRPKWDLEFPPLRTFWRGITGAEGPAEGSVADPPLEDTIISPLPSTPNAGL